MRRPPAAGLSRRLLAGAVGLAIGAAALGLASGCASDPPPPTVAPSDSLALTGALARFDGLGTVLDAEGDAYALLDVASDSGRVLLQVIDLRRAVVTQTLGPIADGPGASPTAAADPAASPFHPTAPSPFVEFMPPGEFAWQQSADDRLLAVLNGAFFETPGAAATQLAFPIAENGVVVTGGSSPYGPGRPGAEAARWGAPLRALGLADSVAHVALYDAATGAPLGDAAFAEAVVSYAPGAHPTRIATRFQVVGALDADGDGATETLLVATSDGRTTIDAPAALLARLGAAPEHQLALDGGASVFLWNRRAGTLHQPAPAGGRGPQPLPHLLTVRIR